MNEHEIIDGLRCDDEQFELALNEANKRAKRYETALLDILHKTDVGPDYTIADIARSALARR